MKSTIMVILKQYRELELRPLPGGEAMPELVEVECRNALRPSQKDERI